MTSSLPLAAVVLAGGASRRMGRDKATLAFASPATGATTLVEHAVSIVRARCTPVFVIAAPGQPLPELPPRCCATRCAGWGPCWRPAEGLRAAAEAGLELAFVCAVDMP